jgi:hypothetical protein
MVDCYICAEALDANTLVEFSDPNNETYYICSKPACIEEVVEGLV